MSSPALSLTIRGMGEADLPVVLEIDQLSFPVPWSERTYRSELSDLRASNLHVAEVNQDGRRRIVGYIGYWFIMDEAHISTLAVHPEFRQMGIGEHMLRTALDETLEKGILVVTLEVRKSNDAAIRLYQKFGFEVIGTRSRYYRDNSEDAHIMALKSINRYKLGN